MPTRRSAARLKVVFLPDYNVKLGQRVYPAADLSEQISLAGKEASGTGNMKFAMNGALTIGTLDGANIEIREEVGEENFFLFGLTTPEVEQRKRQGYNPRAIYDANSELREVLDSLAERRVFARRQIALRAAGQLAAERRRVYAAGRLPVLHRLPGPRERGLQEPGRMDPMSILNVARIGKFSSDRSIRDYCADIWKTWPVKIQL